MDGFSSILDTGYQLDTWVEVQKMTKDKLIDGKKLLVGLKPN